MGGSSERALVPRGNGIPHPVEPPSSGYARDLTPGMPVMSGRLRRTLPPLRRDHEGSRLETHWIATAYRLVVPLRTPAERPEPRPGNEGDPPPRSVPIARPEGDAP